jgi:hypothetical protein
MYTTFSSHGSRTFETNDEQTSKIIKENFPGRLVQV